MSSLDPARADDRLRIGPSAPRRRARVDAEISVPPRFGVLAALALGAGIIQSTLLSGVEFRGAHVSLLIVLVVWTGLRCGVVTGGWLGLLAGLIADALGGNGVNILGFTLAGFGAGLLANRFFWDSFPVFIAATAAAKALCAFLSWATLAIAFGERGAFVRDSHAAAWEMVVNCAVAAVALALIRFGRSVGMIRT
jgi:rod shape-determining protein MreD